jgi:hypothetical protein
MEIVFPAIEAGFWLIEPFRNPLRDLSVCEETLLE